LTSGDVVATAGPDLSSAIMLDAEGETVGFDLYCEVHPNTWVHASQVPAGVLAEERRRGQLQHGIYYNGKLMDKLNVRNIYDRLIAAKVGLEKAYRGEATAFKAQIGNPLEQLAKQVQALMQKLEELRTLESEARKAEIQALKARVKRAKRTARMLKEEIKPEDVVPHPLDYLTDVTRAFAEKTLSTAALEKLAKAQHIAEYVDENNDLLANPKKMAALRNMLRA